MRILRECSLNTPEAPPGFTNVKNVWASVTGYVVNKITRLVGEMASTDREKVVRASYLDARADVLAGMVTWALTRTR